LFDIVFIYSIAILFSVIQGTGEAKIWLEEYKLLFFFPASLSLAYLVDIKKYKLGLPAMLAFCGILSVNGILSNYNYFHEKMKYTQRLVHRGRAEEQRKYIISTANVPGLYIDNTWPVPF